MEIKAKDMCPRCKHCLGMTHQGMYSCGKANDGSELNIGIDVILNCANFEWKDGKVEGKVSDICSKCKNCKGVTKESNGVHVWLTEIECEDPYDGMTKTLTADSDIRCSMFEMKSEKSCDRISLLRHELEMDKLRRKIHELEKEVERRDRWVKELQSDVYTLQNEVLRIRDIAQKAYDDTNRD